MKLTLIGNGLMAQALARGLVNDFEVEIIGRSLENLNKIKEEIPKIKIKQLEDKEDLTNKNVILCVKPYALQSVSGKLIGEANTIFSILAGTTIESLKSEIKAKSYIRTMPNVAASVSKSTTTITGDVEAKDLALKIFNNIGKAIWVDTQNQLDIATAVAGSGPAYLSLIAESLADGAVKSGLDRKTSNELVQGLFEGFSELLKDNHPALIKDSVMSPGGTTAAAFAKLEEGCVRDSMIKAVEAAYKKACEIGKK